MVSRTSIFIFIKEIRNQIKVLKLYAENIIAVGRLFFTANIFSVNKKFRLKISKLLCNRLLGIKSIIGALWYFEVPIEHLEIEM